MQAVDRKNESLREATCACRLLTGSAPKAKRKPKLKESLRDLHAALSSLVEEYMAEELYPPGTVRKWRSGTVIKTRGGEWVPYAVGSPHVSSEPPMLAHSDPVDTAAKLAELQKAGVLPKDVSPDQHVAIAQEVLKKQEATFPKALETLKELAVGEGTAVMGRVKEVESALGKLIKKPKYGTAEKLMDGTGFRIVCNSVDDILKSVDAIKKRFKTSEKDEEDYINKPKDGYRSYHLIIQDDDGYYKEVQIRTPNQDTWANWCHDVYKPRDAHQMRAVTESGKEILDYGARMSEYYYAKDRGDFEGRRAPPCPEVVEKTFGCLPL